MRRIGRVIRFISISTRREYSTKDYLSGNNSHDGAWVELPVDTPTPFDVTETSNKKSLEVEQIEVEQLQLSKMEKI